MTQIDSHTHRSPCFRERRDGNTPRMIIIHSIGMETEKDALNLLCGEPFRHEGKMTTLKEKVSTHYLITQDGKIFGLVDEENSAWHAGESFWRGTRNLNDYSVGIELTHDGEGIFSGQQMESVVSLCHDIVARWNMDARMILAHSDVAPLRKKDPGQHFDWRVLAREGLGVMPSEPLREARRPQEWRFYIQKIGYDTQNQTSSLRAFQRHFMMMGGDHRDFGKGSPDTIAALDEMWRLLSKNWVRSKPY